MSGYINFDELLPPSLPHDHKETRIRQFKDSFAQLHRVEANHLIGAVTLVALALLPFLASTLLQGDLSSIGGSQFIMGYELAILGGLILTAISYCYDRSKLQPHLNLDRIVETFLLREKGEYSPELRHIFSSFSENDWKNFILTLEHRVGFLNARKIIRTNDLLQSFPVSAALYEKVQIETVYTYAKHFNFLPSTRSSSIYHLINELLNRKDPEQYLRGFLSLPIFGYDSTDTLIAIFCSYFRDKMGPEEALELIKSLGLKNLITKKMPLGTLTREAVEQQKAPQKTLLARYHFSHDEHNATNWKVTVIAVSLLLFFGGLVFASHMGSWSQPAIREISEMTSIDIAALSLFSASIVGLALYYRWRTLTYSAPSSVDALHYVAYPLFLENLKKPENQKMTLAQLDRRFMGLNRQEKRDLLKLIDFQFFMLPQARDDNTLIALLHFYFGDDFTVLQKSFEETKKELSSDFKSWFKTVTCRNQLRELLREKNWSTLKKTIQEMPLNQFREIPGSEIDDILQSAFNNHEEDLAQIIVDKYYTQASSQTIAEHFQQIQQITSSPLALALFRSQRMQELSQAERELIFQVLPSDFIEEEFVQAAKSGHEKRIEMMMNWTLFQKNGISDKALATAYETALSTNHLDIVKTLIHSPRFSDIPQSWIEDVVHLAVKKNEEIACDVFKLFSKEFSTQEATKLRKQAKACGYNNLIHIIDRTLFDTLDMSA